MSKARHILLVEDDADSALALSRLLEGAGYTVNVAGSGSEALSVAASQPLDLVLCDVGLPDCDGSDLMRELGEQHGLSCIALTGHSLDDEADSCVAHLMKPVAFEQVCRVIEGLH